MQEQAIKKVVSALPEELTRLHVPPKRLTLKGNVDLLQKRPRVGIVGARKFTTYGREVTEQIAATLGRAGVVVVSGLALGVDSIAHKACLDAKGKTIAVLPSGVDNVYPASHRGLAKQIIDSDGLLLSEYADNFKPHKTSFVERNRIIAALSDILIITEAANASGSLHTANFGLELGVTIMAVPGNINNPYSEGANKLIKTGAQPILKPSDVLEVLGINESDDKNEYIPENEAEAKILKILRSGVSSANKVIEGSGLEISEAQTTLTMLEINGIVSVQSGQWSIR